MDGLMGVEALSEKYEVTDDAEMTADMVTLIHGDERYPFGTDTRRMQVRAYDFWLALAGKSKFPAIDDLEMAQLGDFGDCAMLFDCSTGIDNPAIVHMGEALRRASDADCEVEMLDEVEPDTLIARLADHLGKLISNEAPIGFEAEFVNAEKMTIMYRGILLPFSSDDDTIDFVLGVLSWKDKGGGEDTISPAITVVRQRECADGGDDYDDDDENTPSVASLLDRPVVISPPVMPEPVVETRAPTTIKLRSMKGKRRDAPEAASDAPTPPRSFAELVARVRAAQIAAGLPVPEGEPYLPPHIAGATDSASPPAPDPTPDTSTIAAPVEASPKPIPIDATGTPLVDDAGFVAPLGEEFEETEMLEAETVETEIVEAEMLPEPTEKVATEETEMPAPQPVLDTPVSPPVPAPVAIIDHEGPLSGWLTLARQYERQRIEAEAAYHAALHRSIGQIYDLALVAQRYPDDLGLMLHQAGVDVAAAGDEASAIAPLVHLVLGTNADDKKVADCCTVVAHAFDQSIGFGALPAYLDQLEGGVRAITGEVAAAPAPQPFADASACQALFAEAPPLGAFEFASEGGDFVLLLARKPE